MISDELRRLIELSKQPRMAASLDDIAYILWLKENASAIADLIEEVEHLCKVNEEIDHLHGLSETLAKLKEVG